MPNQPTDGAGQTNTASLTGQVAKLYPLRHTPAGVPVLSLDLHHQSQSTQGEFTRQLDFSFTAVAVGALAQQLSTVTVGQLLFCQGFIAPRHRESSFLVLHIQSFKLLSN